MAMSLEKSVLTWGSETMPISMAVSAVLGVLGGAGSKMPMAAAWATSEITVKYARGL